jgi:glycosyltransferase involved in cell wall biosynthesis
MRILHIVGGLNRGGVETWLVQVLRHIDRGKYQFDFLVHGKGPFDYQSEVEALDSRVISCFSHTSPPRYARNFHRVLQRYGPYDCVHSHVHYFGGFPLLLARRAGISMRIVQSHLDTVQCDKESSIMRRGYAWTMKRMIWSSATKGIAVSERAADALFPSDWKECARWEVMPLGIDLEPFQRSVDRLKVRQELGIPQDAFVVGHVGRFVDQKNHLFLLDIAAELFKRVSNAVFLLLGDGPLRATVESRASALGLGNKVMFGGVRTDIARLMKGAMDAFVLPSRYEGLGLVVLEAQAAGLPCLISDVVPEEANAGVGLVFSASLKEPPAEWAGHLMRFCGVKKATQDPSALAGFNSIQKSSAQLQNLYGASCT